MTTRPVEAELDGWRGRRADMTMLIVIFRNSANAPKNEKKNCLINICMCACVYSFTINDNSAVGTADIGAVNICKNSINRTKCCNILPS
jgi:hypothetical protein